MGILLKDVSIRTMIGLLPLIITDNNKRISDYFDNIYDSDEDRIIKNVYAIGQNGFVKSHLGEFTTLEVDVVNINDETSRDNIVKERNHDLLSGRYLWNNGGKPEVITDVGLLGDGMSDFCHNANAIGVELGDGKVLSMGTVINDIIKNIDKMKSYHPAMVSSDRVEAGEYVTKYGVSMLNDYDIEQPTSFTFDNGLLFASKVQLKRMNLPQYQYDDLTSGFIYTYYDYANVVTISDEHTASIKGIPGSEVVIKFNDTLKKAFYRILLSRAEKKCLRVSKDELVRLRLICTGNDELNGTTWDVKDYSVRNADDLVIERK